MNDLAQQQNQDFGIPADVEAKLRAQAAALVAAEPIDEKALLAKFAAEARAKREEAIRKQAMALDEEVAPTVDNLGFPKKYYKINIYAGRDKTDLSYVPVQVNGFAWKIQRGLDVIVHSVVVDVLRNAITERVVQNEGGLITTPVHRFQFQLLGEATEEEYQAFKAVMKSAGSKAAVV